MIEKVIPANSGIALAIQQELQVPDPPKHAKAMENLLNDTATTTNNSKSN
jgi:hypothetical protein